MYKLMLVLIQIMLQEGYDAFTADNPAVAVGLKAVRPISYPLTWTLSVAYKHI